MLETRFGGFPEDIRCLSDNVVTSPVYVLQHEFC